MARYVKTGYFDPGALLYDEAERVVVAQRRETRQPATPPLRLNEKSTPEEIDEYRRRSRERQAEMEAAVENSLSRGATAFDYWCVSVMYDLYDEAWWLGETHQFRDGRPLGEQQERRLGLLAMIRSGITERQWGGGEKGGDDGGGEPPSRDMTPEEIEAWLGKHP
jgi:hypothetical protein